MTTTTTDLQARAALLTVSFDGDDYVIGRPGLGCYIAVPEPGAVFVTSLQAGLSLAEATARASDVAGEVVDGADFLEALTEAGLLDLPVGSDTATPGRRGRAVRWIEGISPRAAAWLFTPVAWTGYGVAAVFAIGVLVVRPELRPTWEQLWFLPDPLLSVLAYVLFSLLSGAIHEMWHWLAGRAVGVPAVFRVSYRGVFLVFETDLTQLVALPRGRRYGPFLAGMAFDVSVLAGALGLRLLVELGVIGLPAVVVRLLALLVLANTLAIAWQWIGVFLRTDGYAVMANALRCHDLYRITWLTAKNRLVRLPVAEREELAAAGARDQSVARWFGAVFIVGMIATLWLYANVVVPSAVGLFGWVAADVTALAVDTVAFWESVAVLAFLVAQYGLPPLLALRERRLRKAGVLR
jgi:putative peptide zinc metalloprotease protein